MLTAVLMLPIGIQLLHSCDSHEHDVHFSLTKDNLHKKETCCELCDVVININYLAPELTNFQFVEIPNFNLGIHKYLDHSCIEKRSFKLLRAPPTLG